MDFGIGLVIAALSYGIIATQGWSLGKQLLVFAPCALFAVFLNSIVTDSAPPRSLTNNILDPNITETLTPSDSFTRTPNIVLPQSSLAQNYNSSNPSTGLRSRILDAAGHMEPTFGERTILEYEQNVSFSQAHCINTANTSKFSLNAVPPEIWVYCAGSWNMDYVRQLIATAIKKDIHPSDFLDPDKMRVMLGTNLSDSEARSVFRDLAIQLHETVPDMYDVFAFSRYVQIGELYRVAGSDAFFTNNFDVHQRQKARALSELYSPDDVVIFRKNRELDLLVSIDPEVHLVTNVLSDISVRELVQSYVSATGMAAQYRAIFGTLPPKFVMVFSDEEVRDALILNVSVFNLLVESVQLQEAGLDLARPFSELSNSPTWLYFGNGVRKHAQCGTKSPPSAPAFYCEETKSIFAPSLKERGETSEFFDMVSPEMLHELYHAFLNPSVANQSTFIAEILATGRGERAARTYQASIAARNSIDHAKLEEMNRRFVDMLTSPSGTADKMISVHREDVENVKNAIEQQPVTEQDMVQGCHTLQYLAEPEWLSAQYVLDLNELDSVLWSELTTEARHRAYAAAWAIGSFGRYGDEKTLFEAADVKPVFDAATAQEVNNDAIETSLAAIKKMARIRVKSSWCDNNR